MAKALDYWEALDKAKPNDPEIMGSLAGINLKANDWRKSIEWYGKLAGVATEASTSLPVLTLMFPASTRSINSTSDRGVILIASIETPASFM